MIPDGWGFSPPSGEAYLVSHYPGVGSRSVYCRGVIMRGHESSSSWVLKHSATFHSRFWDKLYCVGFTHHSHYYRLVLDAKGQEAGTISGLHGVTLIDLINDTR